MGRGRNFFQHLADEADLAGESLPGQPVVEIAGDHRVLIEHHFGVKEYSRERITVKVKYGCVSVCGCQLELLHMTREQLVISGNISCVTLQRREKL